MDATDIHVLPDDLEDELSHWDAGRLIFAGQQLMRWLDRAEATRVAAAEFNTELPHEN
jgi:hypothetical protein